MKRSEIDWDKEIEAIKKKTLNENQRKAITQWAKNIYPECDDEEFPDVILDEIYHEAYQVAVHDLKVKHQKKLLATDNAIKEISKFALQISSIIRNIE